MWCSFLVCSGLRNNTKLKMVQYCSDGVNNFESYTVIEIPFNLVLCLFTVQPNLL